jgi:hypothetical protein
VRFCKDADVSKGGRLHDSALHSRVRPHLVKRLPEGSLSPLQLSISEGMENQIYHVISSLIYAIWVIKILRKDHAKSVAVGNEKVANSGYRNEQVYRVDAGSKTTLGNTRTKHRTDLTD